MDSLYAFFLTFDWSKLGQLFVVIGGTAGITQLLNIWNSHRKAAAEASRSEAEVEILTFESLQKGFESLKKNIMESNGDLEIRLERTEQHLSDFKIKLTAAEHEVGTLRLLIKEQELKIQLYEAKIDNYIIKIKEYEKIVEEQNEKIASLNASQNISQDKITALTVAEAKTHLN